MPAVAVTPVFLQHVQDHPHGKFPGRLLRRGQVIGGVDEHLVNGIHVHVFRRNVFQINLIYPRAVFHIIGHPGRRNEIIQFQPAVRRQCRGKMGFPGKSPARSLSAALGVDLLYPLNHLEQPGPSRNFPGLQRRGNRQADGLLRAAFVRHHQQRIHGIQLSFHAFHRSIKGLQVNGDIRLLLHASASL